MPKPFVRACNCVVDQMSKIHDADGLPSFSTENQIVFVDNHNWSVGSENPQRNSLSRPGIVFLQWDIFQEKAGMFPILTRIASLGIRVWTLS